MAMKKISTDDQSLLCASIYINNFKRAIEELVYNSLDAASSSIAIRIYIQESLIQVLDNGSGIDKDNFGLLGQKYATSKYVDVTTLKYAPNNYGYRGLSLATIIDISRLVRITSRHENSHDTWMKTFLKGKENETRKSSFRPSKGTTVEIKGFLFNLKIQRQSIDLHNELRIIKIALQQLSFVHCNVSFSLRDDSRNVIILQINKNKNIGDRMKRLLQINEKDFQEFQVEKNEYKVNAYIGKNIIESNSSYQWIYINGKFIDKSILHKKISVCFFKFFNTLNNNTRHMLDYEHVPFYFLFISCPNYDFNITHESEKFMVEFKDWREINKLIEKLVQFYIDSLMPTKKDVKKIRDAENKSVTKAEVKGIVDKILKNKNLPTKISQLKNGVKGKILKRNIKKKKINLEHKLMINKKTDHYFPKYISKISERKTLHDKLIQRSINLSLKYPELSKNDTNKEQVAQVSKNKKEEVANVLENSFIMPPHSINPKNKMIGKKKKQKHVKTEKYKYVSDSLIKKFKASTKKVRKRNKRLKQKMFERMNKLDQCVINEKYSCANKETPYQNIKKNSECLSFVNKTDIAYISEKKYKANKLNHKIIIQKSYDLIHTIIRSQYSIMKTFRQAYERKANFTYNETCTPMHTYNSHGNSVQAFKKLGCYLNEDSLNKGFLIDQEQLSMSNKNILCKSIEVTVRKENDTIKTPNSNYLNIFYNQHQSYLLTVDVPESPEITESDNKNLYSTKHNVPEGDLTESLHFGNTYTFKQCVRFSKYNDSYSLNKTYSLKMFNVPSTQYNFDEYTQLPLMPKIDDNKRIYEENEKDNFIPTETGSDKVEIIHHSTDPMRDSQTVLPYCNRNESLFCSSELRHFVNEFENSFNTRRNDITQTDFNFSRFENSNIDNDLHLTVNNVATNLNNISQCIRSNNTFTECKEILQHKEDKYLQGNEKYSNHDQELPLEICCDEICSDQLYNFQLKRRNPFIPKGMSPIAKNQCQYQKCYTLNDNEEYYKDMIYKHFAIDIVSNTEMFEPGVQNVKTVFAEHNKRVNIEKQNDDLIFDTTSLVLAKILGQVDCKFIAAILNGRLSQTGKSTELLVLFDQHAVDERIRLENNLSDYIEGNDWKSIHIDPISILLSEDDYLYLVNYKDKIARFGLQWTFTPGNEILLNAIPKAILGRNPRQKEIVMKAVKKLISEQIKAIKSLRGNISMYPKSIMDLVFSEACRYAIKFGDKLSKIECSNMIISLAKCKTPFQCAHGRPVMAVLMELGSSSRTYKVNIENIKIFKYKI